MKEVITMGNPKNFDLLKITEGLGYDAAETRSIMRIEILGTGEVVIKRKVQDPDGKAGDYVPGIAVFDSWNFHNEDPDMTASYWGKLGADVVPKHVTLSRTSIEALRLLQEQRLDGNAPIHDFDSDN